MKKCKDIFYQFYLKGMIIMASAICHNGYCETILDREENSKMTFGEKTTIISGYVLFVVALGVALWYGASAGYYPDVILLS